MSQVVRDGLRQEIWSLLNARFLTQLDTKHRGDGGPGFRDHDGLIDFPSRANRIGIIEDDNVLRMYSIDTGKVIATLSGVWNRDPSVYGYGDGDPSFATSPDGKRVALKAHEQPIRIFNIETKAIERQWGSEDMKVCAFSPDGTWLITATSAHGPPPFGAQKIQIWITRSGELVHETLSTSNFGCASFSPDGKRVAIWGRQGAEFWQPGSGELPVKFSHMAGPPVDQREHIEKIVFDESGHQALIVGEYRTHIWDFQKKARLASIDLSVFSDITFLPDRASFLAAAISFREESKPFIGIWRLSDGQLMVRIPTERNVNSIAVAEDGTYAATAQGGIVDVWDLQWLRFVDDARAMQRHVCDTHFIGGDAYSAEQLEDPILRGQRTLTTAPCARRGPLSITYWRRLFAPTPSSSPTMARSREVQLDSRP